MSNSLDARHLLLACACAIFVMGLVMIFSTTSADILDTNTLKSTWTFVLKQWGYAICGLGLGFATCKLGYKKLFSYSPLIMNILIIMLVLTLLPGVGREVNGSKRWLSLFGFSFQPSEFVKVMTPAYFTYNYLKLQSVDLKDFLKLLGKSLVPLVLILIEPNNGTTLVIALLLLVTFWLLEVPAKFWAFPLLGFLLVGVIFASQLGYVERRLKVYFNPESDLRGRGHQPYQAKIAAGSGGFLGKGPGASIQKLSYLPEAQNDYIAAIFAEEFGFIGILSLIVFYMTFSWLGFHIAARAPDQEGFIWASGLTFLMTFQAFLNLGVVSGLVPSTGLNLPLFSQGGTSLMANMVALAILYDVGGKLKYERA